VRAPGELSANCCGVNFDGDPSGLLAHARASRKAHHRGDRCGLGIRPPIPNPVIKVFVKPKVTLTDLEKEWLGRYVTVHHWGPDVWQVWALHPERGYVWIVRHGQTRAAHMSNLVVRAAASGYDDVAFNFEAA